MQSHLYRFQNSNKLRNSVKVSSPLIHLDSNTTQVNI